MMENQSKRFAEKAFQEAFPDLFAPTSFSEIDEHPEEHPAADIEFLEALEAGTLSEEERASFLKHIECCQSCRRELGAMISSGFLFGDSICDIADQPSPAADAVKAAKPASFIRKFAFSPILSAAVVLLVVAGVGILSIPQYNGYVKGRKGLQMIEQLGLNYPAEGITDEDEAEFQPQAKGVIPKNDEDGGLVTFGSSEKEPLHEFKGDLSEVEKVLTEAAAARPNNSELALKYGQFLLYDSHEADKAVEQLTRAAESFPKQSDPKSSEIILTLGAAYYECGKEAEETGNFTKALEYFNLARERFMEVLDVYPVEAGKSVEKLDNKIKKIEKKISEAEEYSRLDQINIDID